MERTIAKNPAVAFPPEVSIDRKKKELTGSFKVLRERGMKFTSVTENNVKRESK